MSKLKLEVDGKLVWEGECKDGACVYRHDPPPPEGVYTEVVSDDVMVDRRYLDHAIWGVEILAGPGG